MMLLDLLRARPRQVVIVAVMGLLTTLFLVGVIGLALSASTLTGWARPALLIVIGSLFLSGIVLSYVAVRTIEEVRRLRAGELAALEELAHNEERFRLLAENARDIIYRYRISPTPGFEYMSPSSTVVTGYTPEEHYADPDLSFKMVHPDDRPILESSLESPQSHLTLRWHHKDGRLIWTEQRNKIVHDSAGNPVAIEGISRDITERKRAEEALRESEEQLRLALEAASLGLWYLDLETGTFVASPQASVMHGLPPNTMLDHETALDVVHPEDRERVGAQVERAIADYEPYEAEFRVVWPDGTVRWIFSRGRTYDQNEDGGAGCLIGVVQDITGRKGNEEALRESEERFRAAFESASIGMALVSLDGHWLQVNRSLCGILGYEEEDLLGMTFQDMTYPEDLDADLHQMRRLLEGRVQSYQMEKRYFDKLGREVWVRLDASLVRDASGEPLYFIAQIQDITQGKKDAEELERLSRQNELILKSAGEGIYGLNLEEETTFVNPAAERILGYEPGELIGRHQHDIIHHMNPDGEPYPTGNCPIYAALRDGKVHISSDEVFWRKDGASFPVEYVSTPIREDGKVVGAVVTFSDITERRQAENDLALSEERFRLLAENMSDLVCLHEPAGTYLYLSPSCRRLLGYDPEELIGTDPYALFHPGDTELIRSGSHADSLKGQEPAPVTYRIRKKSGAYTWFETLTEPICDPDGNVVRLQTSSRDVTDRKLADDALAEAVQAKTNFLADVSHELRTPLTVIRGNAEIGMDLENGCAHTEILEEIVRESTTMSRMVEELLFLGRSDSPTQPFRLEPVSTKSFLKALAGRAALLAQEQGATLEAALEGKGWLRIDPMRIEQAVLALVDNAARYSPEGEEIHLSSSAANEELRIVVEDRGRGIPKEDLPRVFDRFYRVNGTQQQTGNGLGLSIAAAIAETHGGRIEAESSLGEGTRMSLYLPLHKSQAAD